MEITRPKKFYYRVQHGDNLNVLINKFNTSKENILRNNNNIDFYEGEWVIIKENAYILHCVKPMQTIEIIADIYNVSKEKIIADNNLFSNKLFIGQQLKIYKE